MASAAVARHANQSQNKRLHSEREEGRRLQRAMEANEKFHDAQERSKWLSTHDKNASGVFERDEFNQLLKDVAPKMLPHAGEWSLVVPESLVDKFYRDKTGLNVDEVYASLKRCIHFIKSQTRLEEMFRQVDNDNSGTLDKAELKSLLQRGCPPNKTVSDADVQFVLSQCDDNDDAMISLEELGPAVACWMEALKQLPSTEAINQSIPPSRGGPKADAQKSSACVLL